MPRGSKEKYTDKQKRQAEHIEEGYKERGVSEEEAESRAWATVNKMTGGGKKPGGSGYGEKVNKEPARKGGRKGAARAKARSAAERSSSAKKAARTRARNKAARSAAARKGA
jgi:plasmid stabilization system protein ParE